MDHWGTFCAGGYPNVHFSKFILSLFFCQKVLFQRNMYSFIQFFGNRNATLPDTATHGYYSAFCRFGFKYGEITTIILITTIPFITLEHHYKSSYVIIMFHHSVNALVKGVGQSGLWSTKINSGHTELVTWLLGIMSVISLDR